jgi:pheromone shutdown protein TraB
LPSGEDLKKTVEALKDTDALTQALRELSVEFPSLLRPLIHERDEFMVMQLRMMGRRPGVENVVAVVGAGHCQGMRDKWEAEIQLEEITRMPPKEDWERTKKVVLYTTGLAVTGTVLTVVCGSVYVVLRLARKS